jgi:predicted nucleic-acid-binding Zn-ribbon protein
MTSSLKCPKCSGEMEEGFVLDQTYGANLQSNWIEGPPAPSLWTGLKMKGRERLPITTMRCDHCGYLESYAEPA